MCGTDMLMEMFRTHCDRSFIECNIGLRWIDLEELQIDFEMNWRIDGPSALFCRSYLSALICRVTRLMKNKGIILDTILK